jgi:hypothetical protein
MSTTTLINYQIYYANPLNSYPHLPLFTMSDGLLQQLEDLGVAIQEIEFPGKNLIWHVEEFTQ